MKNYNFATTKAIFSTWIAADTFTRGVLLQHSTESMELIGSLAQVSGLNLVGSSSIHDFTSFIFKGLVLGPMASIINVVSLTKDTVSAVGSAGWLPGLEKLMPILSLKYIELLSSLGSIFVSEKISERLTADRVSMGLGMISGGLAASFLPTASAVTTVATSALIGGVVSGALSVLRKLF